MKKIILLICVLFNTLFSAQIEELSWQKGESFLTFLEKNKIPLKLYYDLDKEDQELCSEIQSGNRFFSYTEDDGSLTQALIPVSLDNIFIKIVQMITNFKLYLLTILKTLN